MSDEYTKGTSKDQYNLALMDIETANEMINNLNNIITEYRNNRKKVDEEEYNEHYELFKSNVYDLIEILNTLKNYGYNKKHIDFLEENINIMKDDLEFYSNFIEKEYEEPPGEEVHPQQEEEEHPQQEVRQKRSSRLRPLPIQESIKTQQPANGSSNGGKKTSKKEVLGKMRCIYKIPGDRKEYVKYKGKLITVKDYKMLNKKPGKVTNKKPKTVAKDKKAKRPKKKST